MQRKEAIEIIKKNRPDSSFTMLREALETLIPELKESEDEKIRKSLIDYFENFHLQTFAGLDPKKILAWLEKQGEQKPIEWKQDNVEDLTDFENAMMHIGCSFFGQYAGLDPNDTNAIKEQAKLLLDLVPKQEWSEEDLYRIEHALFGTYAVDFATRLLNKIKFLNSQNTWRPSDEQMVTLEYYMHTLVCNSYKETLFSLYQDLKKLREE